jgi:NarL family two-component system response regulator LiaR
MNGEQRISVMIVDDHTVVRDGLKLLLSTYDDLEVVALAGSGEEAIALCARLQPDVVIMDLSLPGIDGPMAIARLRTLHPAMQFIALTSFLEEKLIQRALKAGAVGYLLKSVSGDKLAEAIRGALRGEVTLDASATQLLVQSVAKPSPLGHNLTPREREVLVLLVDGMPNRDIAEALALSHGTVRVYVSNILSKLGASNRTEAASLALRHNLVPDES